MWKLRDNSRAREDIEFPVSIFRTLLVVYNDFLLPLFRWRMVRVVHWILLAVLCLGLLVYAS